MTGMRRIQPIEEAQMNGGCAATIMRPCSLLPRPPASRRRPARPHPLPNRSAPPRRRAFDRFLPARRQHLRPIQRRLPKPALAQRREMAVVARQRGESRNRTREFLLVVRIEIIGGVAIHPAMHRNVGRDHRRESVALSYVVNRLSCTPIARTKTALSSRHRIQKESNRNDTAPYPDLTARGGNRPWLAAAS